MTPLLISCALMGAMTMCKTTKSAPFTSEKIATALPSTADTGRNATGEYELRTEALTPAGRMTITVVRVRDQKVIWQKSIRAGYAKWAGTTTVELLDAPGMLRKDETMDDYIQKIDIAKIQEN